jgi:histidyl-tRNA synthetase
MPSTKPPSGTRDFLATAVSQRQYIVDIVENVYQGYGFEPLETPAFERLSTLLGKYGEEGDQLLFRLLHRGEKLADILNKNPTESELGDLGLRYDLTVPLARIVAEYRQEIPRFYKRYQIQPVWRADRPGKGRFREFWQCDVDVVGSESTLIEAEVLAAGSEVLQRLGFQDFEILINHRQVLRAMMEVAGVPTELEERAIVAVDKLDKIGHAGVRNELLARGLSEEVASKLMPLLEAKGDDNDSRLEWLSGILEANERGLKGLTELRDVVRHANFTPAGPHLRIQPHLARGLSYYTGAIYEAFVPGFGSAIAAGGRYDNLIGMFSKQTIPACGFSLGLERIMTVMEDRGMFPANMNTPQVMLTVWSDEAIAETLRLATDLRRAGLRVDVYPDVDRYGKQFRYAEERQIRYVLLLGEQALADNTVAVKDLQTGDQTAVARTEILTFLQSKV